MEDEGIDTKMEAEHAETEWSQDAIKKGKKKVESQVAKKQRRISPRNASPHRSSSSYTTAEEDQGQWSPNDSSISARSYGKLLARNKELEKLYEDKRKEAAALQHELDGLRDVSCVDASMGQLSSGIVAGLTDPMIHETLKQYKASLLERDEMIGNLSSALEEKNKNEELLEKENQKLLAKITFLQQQLSKHTVSVQNAASQPSISPRVFKALQDENESLKQEVKHKELLCEEAQTKQFSLEAELRELEERNRQQEAELRSAIALARRAQINEDTKQVECLMKSIGFGKNEQDHDTTDTHLWKEAMAAEEQMHQLFVETLESQHRDDLVQNELSLRLEMSEKIRELEEKHFLEIAAMSNELGEKFQALKDEMKETIQLQLNDGHQTDQDEDVPSLEKILLCLNDEKEELKEELELRVKSLVGYRVDLSVRALEEQHDLNLRRQLANKDLAQQQELASLRSSLERERLQQVTVLHQELSKRHKEEINKVVQSMKLEKDRLKSYVTTGGCAMTLLKKQYCMEYKAAFQGLLSSWYGQWKQEMSALSAKLDSLSDTAQTSQDSDLESLQLIGLEEADSLLGEQERLLSEAKDIGQRLIQHMKSSLSDIMKALEVEHSRVVERVDKMRSELEEAGIAARLQVLVDRLRIEKLDLQNRHKVALENMAARHDGEVVRLCRLVQEVQAGGVSEALKAQRLELEQKHQQEVEELRSYFEQKCADVGKNYSEEVYSQHSRKVSCSNSSSECEMGSEIYYTGPGPVMGSLGGSSSTGDSARPVQPVYDSCLDNGCKEREETLKKDFREQFEALRLSLESRYQAEIEALKEEYEVRVEELVREKTKSHDDEISSMETKFEEEKACLCLEIQTLKQNIESEKSKIELLERELELLRKQKEKLQADYEDVLKSSEALREELETLQGVSCHEISREIETTTEEWIDSLEIITEPKENVGAKYLKSDAQKIKREEELALLRKALQERKDDLATVDKDLQEKEEKFKEEIVSLRKSLHENEEKYEEELSSLKNLLQGHKTDVAKLYNSLQGEQVAHKKEIASLQESLLKEEEKHKMEIASLQKSLQEQEEKHKLEVASLRKSLQEEEKHKEEVASLRKSLQEEEKHKEEVASLRKSLQEEEKHKEEIASLRKSLQDDKARHTEEVAALQKRLLAVQELEKKCTKLSERVKELEQKFDVSVNERKCLDEKLSEMKQINAHLKKECLDWELKYIDLNKIDENLKLQLNSANVQRENCLRANAALTEEIRDLELKVDDVEERLKSSEDLSEELEKLRSEKENYLARVQSELREKHEAEVARLKKYYEELQSRTAEGQEDSTQPCELKRLRQELNEALQREKNLMMQCRQWEEFVGKKDANIADLTETLKRRETEATHQIAALKAKLRESHETIDWYDKRGVAATEDEVRTEGCGAPSKVQCPSQPTEVCLGTLLAQIEAQYSEHFRLIQKCAKESQVETAVKFVRTLEQLHHQHERDLLQLDLPTKQSFSRRGSTCHSIHSGDGDCSKASIMPTLDDLLLDQGALSGFSEEHIQVLRKISEELETKHLLQVEGLQATFAQQLKKALLEKEEEFDRMESELRSEQELQIREIRLDAERRLQLRLDEARQDIVHTLENSVQALLTDDGEEERPPELQKLEEKLSAKYRKELELQKEKHDEEIQKLRQQSDARTQRKGVKNSALLAERLAVVTSERDCLRTVAGVLRDLVFELVRYFVSCEDRMNTTILEELALFGQDTSLLRSAIKSSDSDKYEDDEMSSPPRDENERLSLVPVTPNTSFVKRVRFTENLSGVVKCIDDPAFQRFVNVCPEDASLELLEEIDHCIGQLRSEAEALLTLSQKPLSVDEKSESGHSEGLEHMSQQIMGEEPPEQPSSEKESTRERPARRESRPEVFFEEFGDTDHVSSPRSANLSPRGKILRDLMKKARVQLPDIPQISLFLEELCRDWERLVEDFRREEENLRQQVKAADKQLRETRSFMEEQVAEREQERDEIQRLRDVVREKERERTSLGNISKEAESLNHQLHEAIENLRDAEKKNGLLEEERDYLLDKIRGMQENINDLEGQVLKKMQQEASLETRISMLQQLTEEQGKTHLALAQECENLRNDGLMTEEVRALQEKLQRYEIFVKEGSHLQTMQEMRSQLGDIEVLVECRTKLLENASAAAPGSPALSSPSEDVSIRETVEVMRSILREEKEKNQAERDKLPSLPVDTVARLEEKMQRHVRAEEALLKKIRDLDMQLNSLRTNQTEITAERDILSERLQEKLLQTAQLEARVDELRRKHDASQQQAVSVIKGQLSEAQSEMAILREDLETRKRQCDDLQRTLERTQASLQKKEGEVNQIAESHHYLIEQLKSQIIKNIKEKEKLKELYSNKVDTSTALPLLVNSMLDDKNADIDMLKIQVEQLTKQMEKQNREKRDQRCSPIPCDIASSTQLTSHSLQKSGVRCEYSVTPGSSIEYREGEKLRASDKLSRHFVLERSINLTEVESPDIKRQGQADEEVQAELSMPTLSQPPLPPVQQTNLDPEHGLTIPENESMESSIGQEQSQRDAEPSQSRSDRDDTLQSTVDELKTTISNLTTDNKSLKDELTNKESEINRLTEQVISSQNILANLQTKLEEARRMAEYAAASSDLVKENNDLKERCVSMRAELEEDFKQRENELRRLLEAEQSAARAAHQELEAFRSEVEDRIRSAEEQNLLLESEFEKARAEALSGSSKMLIERLESEKEFSKALREELNLCKVRITDLEREVRRLEDERSEKLREAVSRLDELKNCQERLEFLLGENAKLDVELTALRAQQESDQEERARSEYLVQEITHLRAENLEAGRELAELKENMNKMRMDEASRVNQEHKELLHLVRDNNKLKKELNNLRRAIEGVYERESGALSPDGCVEGLSNEDKALILSLRNKMECLSAKDTPEREFVTQKRSRLTRTAVLTNEYCPPGSPLRESESLEDLTGLVRRELDVSAHLDDTLLQSLHPLGNKEKRTQPSTSQVKDHTGRLSPSSTDNMDKKRSQLEVLQQLKNSNVKISTELSETRCAVRLLQNQLEIERARYKTLQEQDSNLIETLRIKLEQALDSEAQMRTLLETERIHRQKPPHQMRSGGGDELMKSPRQLTEHYHEAESCRADVQRQMKALEAQLARALEELEQRRMTQDVIVKKAQALELRRSRKRAADEEQHRKKLDVANMRLEELQKELEGTRRQLRAVSQDLHDSRQLEAGLRRELSEIRSSQMQDHRHILQELENIKKQDSEKICLTDQIKNLMEERNQLQMRISQLEAELASRKVNDNWSESTRLMAERGCWERERTALHTALTQATQKQCSHDSDFDEKVNYLFGKYLRCESYRKALIWQKRYLLLVVNSYQESSRNLLLDANTEITLHYPRPIPNSYFERDCSIRRAHQMSPLRRFRLAAQVVKAIVRMRFLVQRWCRSRRIGSNVLTSKYYVQASNDHTSGVPFGVRRSATATVGPTSVASASAGMAGDGNLVSQPQCERATFTSSRVPVHRNAGPWSTDSYLSAYVSRLNVIQQRFDAVLAHTPNS